MTCLLSSSSYSGTGLIVELNAGDIKLLLGISFGLVVPCGDIGSVVDYCYFTSSSAYLLTGISISCNSPSDDSSFSTIYSLGIFFFADFSTAVQTYSIFLVIFTFLYSFSINITSLLDFYIAFCSLSNFSAFSFAFFFFSSSFCSFSFCYSSNNLCYSSYCCCNLFILDFFFYPLFLASAAYFILSSSHSSAFILLAIIFSR